MTDPLATGAHVPSEREESLVRVLDAYFSALQAGQAPDRAEVLAAHPELAAVLEPRLAALDFIHRTGQAPANAPVQLGDFRILREIGRGAMGVVYEAEQLSLRRRVALKILRLGEPASPEAITRFRREAEMVARLHHTNIVPIFAVGCEQGVHYFAMQLIEGRSLAAAPGGPLPPPREVAGWGRQAAEALAHAHARSIIHRDVKPSNLLLDGEGVVWLSDFGLARGIDETALTASGVQPGTPDYMSPEQVAAAAPIDHRTDLYSLGATLYKLATGRRVFEAENLQQLLVQVREDEPVAPHKHRPDLPRDMETIILRCLAKAPDDRYASAQALADDLRAFTEDRPIKARRPSLRERARRWLAGKRFTGRDLAGIGVAVAIVVALLLLWGRLVLRAISDTETAQLAVSISPVRFISTVSPADTDRPLTGELLHLSSDDLFREPFEIPTKVVHRVPVGNHRLRLTRPGWLSATYAIDIKRNISTTQTWIVDPTEELRPELRGSLLTSKIDNRLDHPRQHLWPHAIKDVQLIEVVSADKGHDVIVLGRNDVVQRMDGKTGQPRWEQKLSYDFRLPAQAKPLAVDWQAYMSGTAGLAMLQFGPNLVWVSGNTATLLCQSGKTGELLWRHSASDPRAADRVVTDFVCGLPQVANVGKDREPGLIVLFSLNEASCYRLQAVTERNANMKRKGMIIWDCKLEGSVPPPRWSGSTRLHETMPEMALATVRRRTVAVCMAGGLIHAIDVRTGLPEEWSPRSVPYRLLRQAQFIDLNGDGNTDVLLLHEDKPHQLTLTALDLASGDTLWNTTWPGVPEPSQDWPLLIDLDGDGRPEVVVRLAEFSPRHHLPDRSNEKSSDAPVVETIGVRVLDGATGDERWERWLARSRSDRVHVRAPFRLLAGPAKKKGEPRELIVASLVMRWRGARHIPELYVDALDGGTSSSRWVWRLSLGDKESTGIYRTGLGKLGWWKTASRDEALLLVPLNASPGGLSVQDNVATYLLDERTGKLRYTATSLERPHTIDLDGDDKPELLGWTADKRWQPIDGRTPTRLADAQRLGDSQPEAPVEPIDDPRREIPLPWNRYPPISGLGEDFIEHSSGFFMVMLPFVLLVGALGMWIEAARKQRQREQGMTEADVDAYLIANRRWEKRWQRAHLAAGLLLVLCVAAAIYALDGEPKPEERYIWTGWYVEAFMAWVLATITLMALTGTVILIRKVLRRLRRKSP